MASVFADVLAMHKKFKVPKYDLIHISDNPEDQTPEFREMIKFRKDFIQEEVDELTTAIQDQEPLEAVDAIIDMMVVGIGLLAQLHIDEEQMQAHWDEVWECNMSKVLAPNREDSKRGHKFDLIKPPGWKGPDHDSILSKYYYK